MGVPLSSFSKPSKLPKLKASKDTDDDIPGKFRLAKLNFGLALSF